MGCKRTIHGWSAGPGGSEWYRLTAPLSQLADQYGWQASVSTVYPSTRVLDPPDIVLVQRPMNEVTVRTVRHWHRKSLTMVAVDLDDDFWSIPEDNPAHRLATPELLGRLEQCLAMADVVTVSTTTLAERVSEHTRSPIRVVGNFVPEALIKRRAPGGRKVTVGWSGSPTHLGDWQANAAGIREALEYSNKIDFHVVGADYRTELGWDGHLCCGRHTPFQRDIVDYYDALDFHVALAPLAPTEFNRSKSDIRILESAAIGAVPVMSHVGPYAKISGRHTGKDGWRQHVADLVSNPAMLHQERVMWREWARSRTIEENVHRWFDIYESVM